MKEQAIKLIQETALVAIKDNKKIKRRDLVEMLNSNIDGAQYFDDYDVERIVQEAYGKLNENFDISPYKEKINDVAEVRNALVNTFYDNDGKFAICGSNTLLKEVIALDDKRNFSGRYINLSEEKVDLIKKGLLTFSDINIPLFLDNLIKNFNEEKEAGGLRDLFTGAGKVKSVQATAENVFNIFIKLIDSYEEKKVSVENSIDNYLVLRNRLQYLYEEILDRLVEFIGDKFKTLEPDLFDFDSIHWLSTDEIRKDVNLKYSSIVEKCGHIVANLKDKNLAAFNDSFNKHANNACDTLKYIPSNSGGKAVAKGVAAFAIANMAIDGYKNLVRSNQESSENANILREELSILRNSLLNDKKTIQTDLVRLKEICANINNKFIPATLTISEKLVNFLNSSLWDDFQKVYDIPRVRELKENKSRLLKRKRELEIINLDIPSNAMIIKEELAGLEGLRDSQKRMYDSVMAEIPNKPSFVMIFFSFGFANKISKEAYMQWDRLTLKRRNTYKDFLKRIEAYSVSIDRYDRQLSNNIKEIDSINKEMSFITSEVQNIIVEEVELRKSIMANSAKIIPLLLSLKVIVNAKLNADLIDVKY